MTRLGLALIFAAWLALGLGGRILRYGPEHEAPGPRAERLVREFLAERGWSFADRTPITGAGLYAAQSFAKPGCVVRLRVAVLGASTEATDVVLASLGPDVVFLSDGVFSAKPSATGFAARAARAGLSLASDRIAPPLVVSPSPKQSERSPCAPPSSAEWIDFSAR